MSKKQTPDQVVRNYFWFAVVVFSLLMLYGYLYEEKPIDHKKGLGTYERTRKTHYLYDSTKTQVQEHIPYEWEDFEIEMINQGENPDPY